MSQSLQQKTGKFIITYDDSQVLKIPHIAYQNELYFRIHVTDIKCLDCNLETRFSEEGEKPTMTIFTETWNHTPNHIRGKIHRDTIIPDIKSEMELLK